MNLKPIETGCLAVVIKSIAGNAGKVVRVGNYIGQVEGFDLPDHWETDIALNTLYPSTGKRSLSKHCSAHILLRIDGGDFEKEKNEALENSLESK
jgi:hypothetical protein